MKRFVPWNVLKRESPHVFEEVLTIVRLRHHVDRAGAIELLDEDWSFQVNRDGAVVALDEMSGFPVVFKGVVAQH